MHRWIVTVLCLFLALPAAAQVQPDGPGPDYDGDGEYDYEAEYPYEEGYERAREESDRSIPVRRVVRLPSGRTEFVTSGPGDQAEAAAAALRDAGARIVGTRNFPFIARYSLFVDLGSVSVGEARRILAAAAPQTRIAEHEIYRLSQGRPRLYAASMVNAPPGGCALGGVRIGMIDGAVDPSHPALAGVRVVTHSVLGGAGGNTDHGTAVAALIAGNDPDGALTGFASGAEVYAVAAFGRGRGGSEADVMRIASALDWLMGQGVRLVNMSFAGPANDVLGDLLSAAAARGAIMVAAAGNDGSELAAFPAAVPGVIAVTAVDAAGRHYRAANTGPHIEFSAPGVSLYVARGAGGKYASGTSYAAPIITGLAARLMRGGAGSVEAIRARLRSQSSDLGEPGRDSIYGWGLARAGGC